MRIALFAAALAAIALPAGADQPATPTSDPVATEAPAAAVIVLVDARPDDEKKTHAISNSIKSCEFGVDVLGDDVAGHLKPKLDHLDRIERLIAALVQSVGGRIGGRQVTVDHYGLYVNIAAAQTATATGGALFGAVGTLAGVGTPNTTAKCSQDKMPFGWFDASELTTPQPPFIVQIAVRLDDRSIAIRSVYSPQKGEPMGVSILAALDKGDAAMISKLSEQFPQ
jgi:hypothetical protein